MTDISIHRTRTNFAAAVESLQRDRELTLGELIDAAVLANHRFRTCRCHEDCPHDGASIDATNAVHAFVCDKLGLTADQANALGGIL